MISRRQAREQAFFLLFEKSFRSDDEDIAQIVEQAADARQLEISPYAVEVAQGACDAMDKLDALITKYSVKWNKKRLSRVVLALLRMSCYELLYVDDVSVGVSINESVELAKKYAAEEDASFLNGVLGTIARQECPCAEETAGQAAD